MIAAACVLISIGCRRSGSDEEITEPAAMEMPTLDSIQPTSPKQAMPIHPGMDEEDDPAAPRSLPKTGELPGWVKIKPIVLYKPDQLGQVVKDAGMVKALRTFHIDRAATCAYEHEGATTDVLFIEAETPTDAYGIFELLTKRGGHTVLATDHSVRAMDVGPTTWSMRAWHGKMCLELSFPISADTVLNAVAQLCNRIVFSVPAADPPLMLQLMSKDVASAAKVWVVRETAALKAAADVKVNGIAAAGLDGRLGLKGNEFLWIASVNTPRLSSVREGTSANDSADKTALPPLSLDESPNLVWVVEYADEAAAHAAHARYKEALASPATDLDRNTKLEEPQSRYLVGTWTRDLEGRLPLLPWLMKSLPGSVASAPGESPAATTATAPAH